MGTGPKNEDRFPIISIYVPPELKFNPYTKQMNKHSERQYDKKEFSENLAYSFLTSNILNKGLNLDTDNIEMFLQNEDYNKLILFTDKKQTPLIYRGLTNYFYNQLMLGIVEKEQVALMKKYNITKFPTLMVYKTQENDQEHLDTPEIEFYKGKVNAKEIVEYLNEFALPTKKYLNQNGQNNSEKKNIKKIDTIDTQFFNRNNRKRIILYLTKNEEEEIIPDYLNKFYLESHGFFHFYKMSCGESNKELCKKINKNNEFPSLLMLNKDLENIEKIDKFLDTAENLPLKYEEIVSEVYKIVSSEINTVDPTNFQMAVAGAVRENKVPIFYFSKDEIPLGLHLVSSDEKILKAVSFFSFPNPSGEILKSFNLNSLPELTIILDDPENKGR